MVTMGVLGFVSTSVLHGYGYTHGFHMGLAIGMGRDISMLTRRKPVPVAVPVLNRHMKNTYLGVGIQIEEARRDIHFFFFSNLHFAAITNTIMKPVDSNPNSKSEQDENEKSKLSETRPVTYLVSRHTDNQQKNLPRNGWHLSMPSSGLFLTLSMLKATVAMSFNVPPRAVNKNRGGLEDSLIKMMRNRLVICISMQRSVGLLRLLLPPTRQRM